MLGMGESLEMIVLTGEKHPVLTNRGRVSLSQSLFLIFFFFFTRLEIWIKQSKGLKCFT